MLRKTYFKHIPGSQLKVILIWPFTLLNTIHMYNKLWWDHMGGSINILKSPYNSLFCSWLYHTLCPPPLHASWEKHQHWCWCKVKGGGEVISSDTKAIICVLIMHSIRIAASKVFQSCGTQHTNCKQTDTRDCRIVTPKLWAIWGRWKSYCRVYLFNWSITKMEHRPNFCRENKTKTITGRI